MRLLFLTFSAFLLSSCAGMQLELTKKNIHNWGDGAVLGNAFGCDPWVRLAGGQNQRAELVKVYHDEVLRRGLLTKEEIAKVECGKVSAGMKAAQVIAALGSPQKINRSGGISGNSQQWVYTKGHFDASGGTSSFILSRAFGNPYSQQSGAMYLYFREGKLENWQY